MVDLQNGLLPLIENIWSAMFVSPIKKSDSQPIEEDTITGLIEISSDDRLLVTVTVAEELAFLLAREMMFIDIASEEEAFDAMGEVANLIGGSIKSLLPEGSSLGLPEVEKNYEVSDSVDGNVQEEVWLEIDQKPMCVRIYSYK